MHPQIIKHVEKQQQQKNTPPTVMPLSVSRFNLGFRLLDLLN